MIRVGDTVTYDHPTNRELAEGVWIVRHAWTQDGVEYLGLRRPSNARDDLCHAPRERCTLETDDYYDCPDCLDHGCSRCTMYPDPDENSGCDPR